MKLVIYDMDTFEKLTKPPYLINLHIKTGKLNGDSGTIPIYYLQVYGFLREDTDFAKHFKYAILEIYVGAIPPEHNPKFKEILDVVRKKFNPIDGRIDE